MFASYNMSPLGRPFPVRHLSLWFSVASQVSLSVAAAALCPYLYDGGKQPVSKFQICSFFKKKKKATTPSFPSKNIKQNGEIQCVVPTQVIPGVQNVKKGDIIKKKILQKL